VSPGDGRGYIHGNGPIIIITRNVERPSRRPVYLGLLHHKRLRKKNTLMAHTNTNPSNTTDTFILSRKTSEGGSITMTE